MADLKPPQRTGDERGTVLSLLQFQRESFLRKVEGLDDDAARSSPVASGTSLLWLTRHLAFAESVWVLGRFAGRPQDVAPYEVPDGDSIGAAVDAYRATWGAVDEVVAGASFDDVCDVGGERSAVDLRWIMAHLLEETARHAGHADILRELLDGSTGR